MTNEELIKKAKELGLSDTEINQFIENQKIAQKYGFTDEYTSINVKIDKNININKDPDETTQENCEHCHDDCCHCHDEQNSCNDKKTCHCNHKLH